MNEWKGFTRKCREVDAANGATRFSHGVHSQMGRFFPATPFADAIYSSNDNYFTSNLVSYYGTELGRS